MKPVKQREFLKLNDTTVDTADIRAWKAEPVAPKNYHQPYPDTLLSVWVSFRTAPFITRKDSVIEAFYEWANTQAVLNA